MIVSFENYFISTVPMYILQVLKAILKPAGNIWILSDFVGVTDTRVVDLLAAFTCPLQPHKLFWTFFQISSEKLGIIYSTTEVKQCW